MATITEDYCSFETAKLLKKKGFDDEYTNAFYDKNSNLYFIDLLSDFSEHPDNYIDIAASTLYVAMKWLRKVHNIHISIMYNDRYAYPYEFHIIKQHYASKSDMHRYTTYEECAEKAIKYCLENLI